MGSGIVLLKHLLLSEILRKHDIPAAVAVAVTVRLRRWNILIYRPWAGRVMRGLPLLSAFELIQFALISVKGVKLDFIVIWFSLKRADDVSLSRVQSYHSGISHLQWQVLYYMNIFFCATTAIFIFHVFKTRLDELPNCSFRHFVYSRYTIDNTLLIYLII